jgi:hypothetical protein
LFLGFPAHSADVPDGIARFHLPEGNNVGHVVRAESIADVFENPITLMIREVHIDIGHFVAIRVQEAFKN